MVATEALTHI